MKLSGIIFDFDGTLANTIPVCCAAIREAVRNQTEREYTDADIMALFGPTEDGIIRALVGDGWEASFDVFLSAYEREHALCTEPFPGIVPLLDGLRAAGIRMAIVTGKGQRSAEISMRILGIAHYFDVIEAGSPYGGVKPAAIARVLAGWDLPPAQVAYVGDAASDMADARSCGAIPLAACWAASADREALERAKPVALFASVLDLQRWVTHSIECSLP